MRRVERKRRILRRLVLGLAVAAIVAPAAQARPDEGTATQGKAKDPVAVIQGDWGKAIVAAPGDHTVGVVQGDRDKTIVPAPGDHTVGVVQGDRDKTIVPAPGDYTLAGYRRALPEDYGTRAVIPVEAVRGPSSFDWGDAFVGAAAAFGLMLLLGGAALGTRHVRPTAA